MIFFNDTLKQYGANPDKLFWFDDNSASLLPYASLVNARNGNKDNKLHALIAVYEWQESPLIYLADGNAIHDDEHFSYIRRIIALRGDAPYLGIIKPGQLSIHRVSLDKDSRKQTTIELNLASSREQIATFPKLINERPEAAKARKQWIANLVLDLLKDAIDDLIKQHHLTSEDAISLTGKALFSRFLADRDLMDESLNPTSCFDDANKIHKISTWLGKTFNGDFLPLSEDVVRSLSDDACKTLGNIARRARHGQLHLGWENGWDYLDFAHIPIGVLSQAYEQYMRDHDNDAQKKEGSFYTPHFIVDLMVRGAFHALKADGIAHKAKILDPAVGAGVFLVSSFQQLVKEKWQHSGKRPDTAELREILYNQITGFDINEGALRFASLGLYLISIELDPNPYPVEKLKFEHNLREKVLYRFAYQNNEKGAGSLGDLVGGEHINAYDLVIGNPPWTTNTGNSHWSEINRQVLRIAKNRLGDNVTDGLLPRQCLDLPFIWRSMEWAKQDGQIAFALSARILFQQGTTMPEARQALFDAIDVSGILNGADLRMTKVWPHVDSPFCLLFAKNRLPQAFSSSFRFVSPRLEQSLNDAGILRVDASNAESLSNIQLRQQPALFKVLFRGSNLDLEILQKITKQKFKTLHLYWKDLFGESRGRLNNTGQGYGRVSKATRKPVSSDQMIGMPELIKENMVSILIKKEKLRLFSLETLHRCGNPDIYQAPLLIVHESPPVSMRRIGVTTSSENIVYSETFYGYSSSGYSDAYMLVKYLALLIGSKFVLWYLLMTSGKFGYEREVIEKMLIQQIPVVSLENFSPENRSKINTFFEKLSISNTEENWQEVDTWIADLFGINKRELQVINDTLQYNLPFAENKKIAQAKPSKLQLHDFCEELSVELAPWGRRLKTNIRVSIVEKVVTDSPWEILSIQASDITQNEFHWAEILRAASEIGTTEVFMAGDSGKGLWVARLKQGRYWSRSQARLLARRIIWEHIDAVFGQRDAA